MRTLRALRGAGGAVDQQSRQLTRLGAKMGNQQMAKSGGAEAVREALLRSIVERLGRMRAVQNVELDELSHVREWYREVADGKAGMWIPEPTRWHEAARQFKEAADALCRGNLEQAAQRLERAIAAEQAAYGALPQMVKDRIPDDERRAASSPAELPYALGAGVLPPCKAPEGLGLADDILAVTEVMESVPPHRGRQRNWWEGEVEAEEDAENADKKDEKGGQTVAQGAATERAAEGAQGEEEEEEQEVVQEKEAPAPERAQAVPVAPPVKPEVESAPPRRRGGKARG